MRETAGKKTNIQYSPGFRLGKNDAQEYKEQFLMSPSNLEFFSGYYDERCSTKHFKPISHFHENSVKFEDNEQKTLNPYEKSMVHPFISENTQTMNQMSRNINPHQFQRDNSDSESNIKAFDDKNNKKGRKQLWNLKGLSSQVKDIINIHGDTNYKSIANKLVDKLQVENAQLSQEEQDREKQNLKRRVYDSINVMVSLGTLEKKGKVIRKGRLFVVNQKEKLMNKDLNLHQLVHDKRKEMVQKRKFFREYTKKLINLKSLIERNKTSTEEEQVFYFPLVAAQTKLDPNGDSVLLNMNPIGEELRIQSKFPINIQGDLDILVKLKHLDRKVPFREHNLLQFE